MNVAVRQTNTLAIVALVSGLLGWSFVPFIGSIVAIITGHLARSEIRRQPERYEGDGLALVGLILGYVALGLAVLAIFAFLVFFGGMAWLAAMHN